MKGLVGEGDVIQGPWKNPVATQKTNAAELASEFLSSKYAPNDLENEDIEDVAEYIVEFLLKYHAELTDNMDIDDIDTLAKRISREAFVQADLLDEALEENLNKWFKEKWVRFGPDGKIRGACARGSDSEGKPKCLPQSKAHSLGKKGRKYAASKKRREDPNPERTGKAKNVATKKKTNEEQLDELKCWSGYTRVQGVPAGAPGSCKKKTNEEASEKCPHCGGELVSEEMMNEKQDACYRKVKSRYKVWPSAYASGALVQCRKKGASNWGTGGKKTESYIMKGIVGEHVPDESIEEEWTHGHGPGNTSHWSGSVNKGKYTHDGKVVAKFESFEHPSTFSQSHIKVEFLPTGKVKQFSNTRSGFNKAEKWVLDSLGVGQTESIVGEALRPEQRALALKKIADDIVNYIGDDPSESAMADAARYEAVRSNGEFNPADIFEPLWKHFREPTLEASSPAQQAAIAINMKKKGQKPKNDVQEDYTGMYAAEKTPAINPYGGRPDRQFRGAISETPSANPTGASGEGGWRTYKAKPAGKLDEAQDDIQYNVKDIYDKVEKYLETQPRNSPSASLARRTLNALLWWGDDGENDLSRRELLRIPNIGQKQLEFIDSLLNISATIPKSPDYYRDQASKLADEFKVSLIKKDYEAANAILKSIRTVLANINKQSIRNEDTAYAGGMGQGGNAGQSYRKFTPKMAGVVKKESAIMKGLRKEGR
jgi:hypothetical protein